MQVPLRRYVATGEGKPFAAGAVLGAALAGALGVGIAESLLDDLVALLIIFPALLGVAAGRGAAWVVRQRHLRAPLLAMLLGAAGGATGYLSTHVVNYLQFRSKVEAKIKLDYPNATSEEVSAALDQMLLQDANQPGIAGYLVFAAQRGVRIKNSHDPGDGLALTGNAAWILWLCELLIATVTAGSIARSAARRPYCEDCKEWYGPEQNLIAGSKGSQPEREQVIAALDKGEIAGAAAVLASPRAHKATHVLTASMCFQCRTAYCTLRWAATADGSRDVFSNGESWLMTQDELSQLMEAAVQLVASQQPRAPSTSSTPT